MTEHKVTFYATAAQVLPVLFLTLALEVRGFAMADSESRVGPLLGMAVGSIFVLGELTALLSLFLGDELLAGQVVVWVALFTMIVVIAFLSPFATWLMVSVFRRARGSR